MSAFDPFGGGVTPKQTMSSFLPFFYRTQVNLGSDLWVRMSVRHRRFVDLTDVTLADEDTNSIPTDNANRAIQENVAMQCSEL